jgi:Holliday junction resolvase-like predicted endonuclease
MTDGMTAEERFLEDLKARRTKGTVKSYRRGFELFLEYYGKNADTVLAERKQDVQSEDFEKKAYPFLARKGFKVTKSRVRSKRREEFDGLATDKHGHTHGVEVKATKQKVSVAVVRKLKKKVARNKLLHGGIIVSQKGFTKTAEQEAKKSGIKTFKYKQKRKKSSGWLF